MSSNNSNNYYNNKRSPGNVYQDAFDAVGSTPLLLLKGPSDATGCQIYGKCEFVECGAGMSVKARAAKWMLLDAEERGLLQPGGTVVEATAGESGSREVRCVVYIMYSMYAL
jgi:cysteine synthase A